MAFRPILLSTVLAVLLADYFTSADAVCGKSNETCNEQFKPRTCCDGLYCIKPRNPIVTDQPGRCQACVPVDVECGGFVAQPAPGCCTGLECVGDAQAYDGQGLCKPEGSTCSTRNKRCRINDSTLDCCSTLTCKNPVDGTGICR